MNIANRILLACVIFLSAPLPNAVAAESTPQKAAVYFAGLDTPASNSERKLFQKRANIAWANYEKRIGQPLLAWAAQEVCYPGGDTVFYPFSGPDFLTIERIYPNSGHYVLVAMQKAMKPSYPEKMSIKQRQAFEEKLGAAWQKFGILGYFITEDLDKDQRDKTGSLGVTNILMAFAARLGYEVMEVMPLGFNTVKNEWEPLAVEVQWKSVRLLLQKDGRKVTLDYLSMDLSDEGLKTQTSQKAWLKRVASEPTLLKAASHLLQDSNFITMRDILVSSSPTVIQDETGLDYTYLRKIGEVKLYGNFTRPLGIFKRTQPALAAAYKNEKSPGELPFAFSYLKKSEKRSIQIARRQPLSRASGQVQQ